ncbi:MAG: hypothetical protein K5857_08260 [Lachnospiraceae bacterium]|nr:hypothetical protein [Lachnospiraceae bacterium]
MTADKIVWEQVYNNDDGIGEQTFYGNVGSMEFKIGDGMLNGLSVVKDLKREDFNRGDLKDFNRTKDDDKRDSATEREYENYSDEAGALRVHYQGISADKGVDSIALIGKQVEIRSNVQMI